MSARAIRAGRAFVELGANDSSLRKGLDAAQARIRSFGKSLAVVGASLSAAGAAITGPIGVALGSFAKAGDALNKMSARTGLSSEALSELGFAAEQSGSNLETLSSALFRMNRRIANAATEGGPAQRAIEALGLSAKELSSMSPDEQFSLIADGLSKMGDEGLAAQLGFEIFGGEVKSLLPLIKSGGDGIADLRKQARDLGLSMSTSDSAAAAKFSDAMNILNRSMQQVWHMIGAAVAPAMTELLHQVIPVITGTIKWADANRQLVLSIAGLGAGLATAGTVLGTIGVALAILPIKTALVATAIGTATAAFLRFTSIGQQVTQWFTSEFGKIAQVVQQTMGGAYDAIKASQLDLAAEIVFTGFKLAIAEAMESVLSIFGTSIDEMMQMLARVFKRINEVVNQLNVARVGAVNFLTEIIGDAFGIDTSVERAFSSRQAQQGLTDAQNFDASAFGDRMSDALNTDKLRDKLEKLNQTAAEAAEAVEMADLSVKDFKFSMDDIAETTMDAVSRTQRAVTGTFQGALAGQSIGAASVMDKQLEIQRKIERNTRIPPGQQNLVIT